VEHRLEAVRRVVAVQPRHDPAALVEKDERGRELDFQEGHELFSENFFPSVQVTSRSPQMLSETARKFFRALSAIAFWLKLVRISSLQKGQPSCSKKIMSRLRSRAACA